MNGYGLQVIIPKKKKEEEEEWFTVRNRGISAHSSWLLVERQLCNKSLCLSSNNCLHVVHFYIIVSLAS